MLVIIGTTSGVSAKASLYNFKAPLYSFFLNFALPFCRFLSALVSFLTLVFSRLSMSSLKLLQKSGLFFSNTAFFCLSTLSTFSFISAKETGSSGTHLSQTE